MFQASFEAGCNHQTMKNNKGVHSRTNQNGEVRQKAEDGTSAIIVEYAQKIDK